MANILILGGGFGGLVTAEKLAKSLAGLHRITLISTSDKFTFYPALVRVAFGDSKPEEITFDLQEKLDKLDVRFVKGEVLEIETDSRRVKVSGNDFNGLINFDYLVIALGRRLATERIPGFFEYAHHILGIKAAQKFGQAVNDFESGHIVVGLSPQAYLPVPVCETAFALARKFSERIARDALKVSVVFPETVKNAFAGADLHYKLENAFKRHHINLITDFPVVELTKNRIISESGATLDYNLLMLVPPFRGQTFLDDDHYLDESNFITVDNFLRVSNLEKIYAVGDIVSFAGPKLAYMATRQARIAADNITSEINGGEVKEIYHHEIAAIIDEGGADTIFLHYGIWEDSMYELRKGETWSKLKNMQNSLLEVFRGDS